MILISEMAIQRERRWKLLFFLLTLAALIFAITLMKNVFISFLLAFVTYYVLAPIVDFLERKGLSRQWSTTLPFLVLTGVGIITAQIFFPILADQITSLRDNIPRYIDASTKFLINFESQASSMIATIYPIDLKGGLEPKIMSMVQNLFQSLPDYVSQSLTVFFLTPFIAYFMLLDGRDFVRKVLSLVPNNFFELVLNMNHQINAQMGGFVRARILESLLVGGIIWLGLFILGFPYALILAVFAGIINIIPYLGPFIGAVPALIINFANGGDITVFWWLLVIYALAQVIDLALIVPFVVAKIVNLHPVTVVLVVILGSHLLGILGMIISIPLFSVLKVSAVSIYKHVIDFRG
ncbi:MAG: hypothetical protein COT73_05365 [Bdellovibrio sp. CG10_big_fil_rev_8_21_14_0_10_47_8]|nr:MAG: hypothetical protein COT73_05365 [Bdellovibrio sp. CG10_big_fil_rev_8_21_14_0_10_47_8]